MKKHFIFWFGLIILVNAVIFAGGKKDENGLKPNGYDKNGWANVNGQWVPSPKGAVYLDTISSIAEIPEEIVYEEITNFNVIESQLENDPSGLDINGLRKSDYNVQGWALKNGKWVASPAGALYAGQENYNLEYLISSIVNNMSDIERGMLKATLLYGKNVEKKAGQIINSPDRLAEYGKDVTAKWVVDRLDASFTKGTGFVDAITGKWLNYGEQLDDIIKNVLVKQMKVPRPTFKADANTVQGAIQRENWIVETILDNFMASMSENDKMEFVRIVAEELEREGITLDQSVRAALATGGLLALRRNLSFVVYKTVPKITNTIAKLILGKGLLPATNRLVSVIIHRVWGTVIPVVGVISLIWTIADIPGLINPRNYDKYIPAVIMIGLSRLSQKDNLE